MDINSDDDYNEGEIEYSEPIYDDDYNDYTIPEGGNIGGLYSEEYGDVYGSEVLDEGEGLDYTQMSEEQTFMDEYGVFERAGFGSVVDIRTAGPYEKLKKYITLAADFLNNEVGVTVTNTVLEDISKSIEKVERPEDINPMGFLLGFLASNGGNNITKDSFNRVSKNLGDLGKHQINPPDLLRYARYWLLLNKK